MAPSLESNSFEHPSFERMGGNFEGAKEPLPELREATPEQIYKSKEYNTFANRLYKSHSAIEASSRSDFEESFNKNQDIIWRTGDITLLSGEKSQTRTEKQPKSPDTPEEKEKLTTYAELSDLAYVDFVNVPDPQDITKTTEHISSVRLDPLAFPNFKMIAEGRIPEKPTEDERIIIAYLDEHKNDINNPVEQGILRARNDREGDREISSDVADLLRIASIQGKGQNKENLQYVSLDGKYQTTMIDAHPNLPPTTPKLPYTPDTGAERTSRMVDAMEHLRTIKEKQASATLDTIKSKGFEIVDYFPNETSKDKASSGFGAICLKDKAGNISFAIRGTDVIAWVIPEPRDVAADTKLALGQIPENQTQDLITFFERNLKNLKEGQKVNITGHSLGGALTQIASVMYAERVNESYTFNSPGAKKLSINPEGKSEIIRQKFEKFRDFEYNEGNEGSVENRMTNARGVEGPSIIANLGEDIGNYEIKLKDLESHSITKVIEYINALKEGSPELQKQYIGPDRKKQEKETI